MNVSDVTSILQFYFTQSMNISDTTKSVLFEALLKCFMEDSSTNYYKPPMADKGGNSENQFSSDLMSQIDKISQKYGVDKDLIKAVIKQESNFNTNAVSKAGAIGLMQLMPSTADSLGVNNPFDALENIDGGTRYLKKLIDGFDGNVELALSAYNGGIGRMKNLGVDSEDKISRMPSETQRYVEKVMNTYKRGF